jgi:hypothetical protein
MNWLSRRLRPDRSSTDQSSCADPPPRSGRSLGGRLAGATLLAALVLFATTGCVEGERPDLKGQGDGSGDAGVTDTGTPDPTPDTGSDRQDTGESCSTQFFVDSDGDGFGSSSETRTGCEPPEGFVGKSGDCDDSDPQVNPSASEDCTQTDRNCDGSATPSDGSCSCTDGETQSCGSDQGVCETGQQECSGGTWGSCEGEVTGSNETCDGKDNDCDGTVDEGVKTTYYYDGDGDGYGVGSNTQEACDSPSNYVAQSGDCNDSDPSINPMASEDCTNTDRNCDSSSAPSSQSCECTPGETELCGQSQGVCQQGQRECTNGTWGACQGQVGGSPETCDGDDNDCDGSVDEGVETTYYYDGDGDGYGTSSNTRTGCQAPGGYVAQSGDCNDSDSQINPGAKEDCTTTDRNCDGLSEPTSRTCNCSPGDTQTCGTSTGACETGTSTCDDQGNWGSCTGNVEPSAEVCDSKDNDCDGTVDEGANKTLMTESFEGGDTLSWSKTPSGHSFNIDTDKTSGGAFDGQEYAEAWYKKGTCESVAGMTATKYFARDVDRLDVQVQVDISAWGRAALWVIDHNPPGLLPIQTIKVWSVDAKGGGWSTSGWKRLSFDESKSFTRTTSSGAEIEQNDLPVGIYNSDVEFVFGNDDNSDPCGNLDHDWDLKVDDVEVIDVCK